MDSQYILAEASSNLFTNIAVDRRLTGFIL